MGNGFQLRNPNPDFMNFVLFFVFMNLPFDWEIRKRICKTILEASGLFYAEYAYVARALFIRTVFQIIYGISPFPIPPTPPPKKKLHK